MPPPAKIKKVENVFEELIKAMKAPVEFDLPSALKEWKLGYYIPIKRNVYFTKRRIEDDGIFCSCTPTSGSTVACDKDCQCGMLFSCCSSNCKCDNKCANKSFQHRPLKKTKLITTEKCGFGLVAEDEIKKGEFVIEYVGEVIDDRTCEERLWKMKRQRDTNFYLCEVSSNMVIDATNKGNMSRFINHSCEPNTEMQKWTVDGETRVGIFALRDIKEGEELTYDYKFVQFGADQDCHCGSSNCRKMLGTTKPVNSIVLHNGNSGSSQDQHVVKKRKTTSDNCIGEIIRLWHRRDKMYVPAVIYGFNEYTKMHTLMFDVDITEEFDMREEDWDFLPVAAKYGLDLQPLSPCCGLPVIGGVTALRATKVWLTTSRLLLQFPTCVPRLLRKNGLVVVLVEDEEEMVWAAGHATFMAALELGWDEST